MNTIAQTQALSSAALLAGAATRDVTPLSRQFLYGYPHVPRISTGTHDSLLASALALSSGGEGCLFLSADVIFVSRALARSVRERISVETGLPLRAIVVSATHTHSGPVTLDYLSNRLDAVVPRADSLVLQRIEDGLVEAGIDAWRSRRPASIAQATADATGIGTCRHDPAGPSDMAVPVIAARDRATDEPIGLMLVCAMHPTVLHEDSTLFSADFPGATRSHLQRTPALRGCPIVYHTGAAGDQSPRHVTRANTFDEADRLGRLLGSAVERSLAHAAWQSDISIASAQAFIASLPLREFPSVGAATQAVSHAQARFAQLQRDGAPRPTVRSAECDVFGAQETLALAKAKECGLFDAALASILPAEVQAIRLGERTFVAWPGEFFVDFALRLRAARPGTHVITLANGDLQGYAVTQEAVDAGWYEAGNALLKSPETGEAFLATTIALLDDMARRSDAR